VKEVIFGCCLVVLVVNCCLTFCILEMCLGLFCFEEIVMDEGRMGGFYCQYYLLRVAP